MVQCHGASANDANSIVSYWAQWSGTQGRGRGCGSSERTRRGVQAMTAPIVRSAHLFKQVRTVCGLRI